MIEDWQNGGFGLYVHWPFCESKCPYCDFNSHVAQNVDQERWARALCAEIERWAAKTGNRVLGSVFFGGGTPSLMTPDTVNAVLDAARRCWRFSNNIEISLEANPRSVEADRFRGYAQAGVNRVSLGVQALNNDDLKRLGRTHDVSEARKAFDIARSVFDRVSFDLIYARQDQTLAAWQAELTEAVNMAVDHLSLYQLTVEPGTAFWDRRERGGLVGLPDQDISADMYDATQEICENAGFGAYEVSNHAKPGAESRHNSLYWQGGDYVGVGPGAHGRVTLNGTRYATVAHTAPGKWLSTAESGNGDSTIDALSAADHVSELVMMGLRMSAGIDMNRLRNLHPDALRQDKLDDLSELDVIWTRNGILGATAKGRLILNAVISELLVG